MRLLEGEVQRLTQTVQDLQATLTGLTGNLRTDLQDDTKKMLVTLLNNMRPQDNSSNPGTEESPAMLDGQATRGGIAGEKALEKIEARLDDINNALKSKDEALDDLKGITTSHEGQIRVLMDASQSQSPAIAEFDAIQAYVDGQFEKLKKELDQNVEEQMVKLQGVCNDRMQVMQKTCEDSHDQVLAKVTNLLDTKEAELKKEIRTLHLDMTAADGPVRTQRQTELRDEDKDYSDHKDLWREIDRISEAYQILNVRVDKELAHLSSFQDIGEFGLLIQELEARVNITEQNAETHCFYIEEKLSRTIAEEVAVLRLLLDERLNNIQDQFTNMVVEMSNSSSPGTFGHSVSVIQAEVKNNKVIIQTLDDKVNAIKESCSGECPGSEIPVAEGLTPGRIGNILKDLNRYRNDLDVLHTDVSSNTDKVKQLETLVQRQSSGNERHVKTMEDFQKGMINLQDNVLGLAGAVNGLSDSLSKYDQDMRKMNSTCCHPEQTNRGRSFQGSMAASNLTSRQMDELRSRFSVLSRQVSSEMYQCKQNTKGVSDELSTVEGRVSKLENVCGSLDGVSVNMKELKDRLERHIGGLRDYVNRLNATCGNHGTDIVVLQNSLKRLQDQMSALAKHALKDVAAEGPGELTAILSVERLIMNLQEDF